MNDNDGSRFSLSVDYTLRVSDDIYRGDTQVSNPNEVKTIFHRYSLTGAYRISDQFVVQATVPFLDGTFEENGIDQATISGLSDISFVGTWRPAQVQALSFNLGLIAPTGDERKQPLVGIAAPSVFQLGTGTWQVLMGAAYSRQIGDWAFSTQFDVSLPLETSSQGFKAAESYFLTAGASHAVTDSLSFGFAVQGSHTTEDEYLGLDLANTGATTISLRPSLVWKINDRLSMSGSVNVPVYRDINQTGIAAGPTWQIGFSTSF
ncbi:MAG: long-subunit fatty acid transport protein [Akkermansiaceae bacterium]